MARSLLESGAIWIEEEFIRDSGDLYSLLVPSIAWNERMRARKAASFGLPYNYSGIVWPAAPFPDLPVPVLERVSKRLRDRPNNCLAHYYSDCNSTMGFHSDAIDDLVPGTGIAVVSLGAEQPITFRSQHHRQLTEQYLLKSSSLLFMSPELQFDWKHAILAAENAHAGRISLTFRCMIT